MDEIGANFSKAMHAHTKWKRCLTDYIEGTSTDDITPDVAASDHHCELGKWLHSEGGKAFGNDPVFNVLKERHAEFHRVAGRIVELKFELDDAAAKALLEGEFSEVSSQVIGLLGDLHKKLHP